MSIAELYTEPIIAKFNPVSSICITLPKVEFHHISVNVITFIYCN